ncbi:MAG: HPr family phosphocarrier protein [Deltaproteobacteria bacterium]|nr:HPr family phosphocarrier protein [Deltaproteobacteria bacterium]
MKIVLPDALHARPANLLVRAAQRLACAVHVRKGDRRADARDILQVIKLGAAKGDEVVLEAEGEGAAEAIAAIAELVAREFDPDLVPEEGAAAAAGIAIGHAVVWLEEEELTAEQGSVDEERARAVQAFARARAEVSAIVAALPAHEAQLFEPEQTILSSLEEIVMRRVEAGESAIDAVRAETLSGPSDLIDDARRRLLDALSGAAARTVAFELRGSLVDAVLVAQNVTPSLVASLPGHVVGVIAAVDDDAATGTTSHAAILARGRGLPLAYVPSHVAFTIEEGVVVVLDTTVTPARIWSSPSEALIEEARARGAARRRLQADAEARAEAPLSLGVAVRVNVGSTREDVPAAADGIGLLRTELVFADRTRLPSEDEQAAAYGAIARKTSGPVHVRLFDGGGDKPLPFLPAPPADPDARGAALLLANPEATAAQLRAIARVPGARAFIPLVRSAADVEAIRALAPPGLDIGAMVETPEAAEDAEAIAAVSDFVCIGTNDLACETLGVSRAQGPDALDPRVLAHVRRTVEGAHARGRKVTVCGEIAADPRGGRVLVGLGVDALSVAPARFASTKLGLAAASSDDCRNAAESALGEPS